MTDRLCRCGDHAADSQGAVRTVEVTARPGGILSAQPPLVPGGRHVIGHCVQKLMFGAVAVLPDRGPAGGGMLNLVNVQGRTREGQAVSSICVASRGSVRGLGWTGRRRRPRHQRSRCAGLWPA